MVLHRYKDFYGIFSAFCEVSEVTPHGWGDFGQYENEVLAM